MSRRPPDDLDPDDAVTATLAAAADPAEAVALARYFQVRPGGYGEGDEFCGVRLSRLRPLARSWAREPFRPELWLPHLRHRVHEHRLLALVTMAERAKRGDPAEQRVVYETYLANTDRIDNWDLVDVSAAEIVGGRLLDRDRTPLDGLARSASLWERRIAIVSTHRFLFAGDDTTTYRIAEMLLDDEHDLIHKATGWMLREAGKRVDRERLRSWLGTYGSQLPRTALRYAIEHFDAAERRRWLTVTR